MPGETGVDGAYAARTANKASRTTPLGALWQHPPYNRVRTLDRKADQQLDLVEYLKSR